MTPRLMSIALRLAARGWYVFPLRCRAKRPLPNFTGWEERATRDPDRIYLWWREMPYNIGVATGPSKLLVIDCDTAEHTVDWCLVPDGVTIRGRLIPVTFTVRTPSGGRHLYFQAPRHPLTLGNTAGMLGRHVDTRGAGGYVVAPGSVRSDGYYTITEGAPVAPLPGWLIGALTSRTQPAPVPPQLI